MDLYQIHTFDPYTPLEETLRTLDDLISAGKVRYIGASNYAAWELMKALGISEARHFAKYISIQCSYSLADRTPEAELLPLCLDQGLGIIPYFPLAGGILTGKYTGSSKAPAYPEQRPIRTSAASLPRSASRSGSRFRPLRSDWAPHLQLYPWPG